MPISKILKMLMRLSAACLLLAAVLWARGFWGRERVLKQVIQRLSADSRAAEVLVTKSEYDEITKKIRTTIKFLEYDSEGRPLTPRTFSFQGNLIQFQALVVRFEDPLVKAGSRMKGKSAYIFLKAFVLDGAHTQVFEISPYDEIPGGYKLPGAKSEFEKELWLEFWRYALDPEKRARAGIKNAQIEAPGSLFLPGTIYTLRIEHDGGLRIDTRKIPEILKGENL